jgi:hypothetical protein
MAKKSAKTSKKDQPAKTQPFTVDGYREVLVDLKAAMTALENVVATMERVGLVQMEPRYWAGAKAGIENLHRFTLSSEADAKFFSMGDVGERVKAANMKAIAKFLTEHQGQVKK